MDKIGAKDSSRRNFVALLIDAIGWPLGQSFLSSQTILPMFVARLSGSNALVGLMNGIQSFGTLFPQLIAANRVEELPSKKRYLLTVGMLVERLPFLVLAISAFLIRDAAVLLAVFFACWSVTSFGNGFNLPAYMGLLASVIPAKRRGMIMGLGNGVGTLLATGGAYLARHLLQTETGLRGYAWCFLLGVSFMVLSLVPMAFVDEGRTHARSKRQSLVEFLREVPSVIRTNGSFGNYIFMQICLQLPLTGVAFLTSYAILDLQVSEPIVALCSALFMGASTVGSLLCGLLGDSGGYRRVFIIGSVFGIAAYSLMATSPQLSVVYVAFAASGILTSSVWVGNNMSLEFCHESRAATYSAVAFTCTAPFRTFLPVLAGWSADRIGFVPVFIWMAASSLIALYLAVVRVSDPRHAAPCDSPSASAS
jgi:MFS family permease